MSTESLRTVRDRLSEFVERAQKHHEQVVITKNGATAAALMSAEDLESLDETVGLLSDEGAMAEIAEAEASIANGACSPCRRTARRQAHSGRHRAVA